MWGGFGVFLGFLCQIVGLDDFRAVFGGWGILKTVVFGGQVRWIWGARGSRWGGRKAKAGPSTPAAAATSAQDDKSIWCGRSTRAGPSTPVAAATSAQDDSFRAQDDGF